MSPDKFQKSWIKIFIKIVRANNINELTLTYFPKIKKRPSPISINIVSGKEINDKGTPLEANKIRLSE